MNFYEERLKKLKELYEEKKYSEALKLINLELSMPYIPQDFEENLYEYSKKILQKIEKSDEKQLKPENIFHLIQSSEVDQIQKIGLAKQLENLNLRKYPSEIDKLLNSTIDNEIKMIVIYLLNEQNVNHVFIYKKDNQVIEINPATFDFDKQEMVPQKLFEIFNEQLGNDSVQLLETANQIAVSFYAKTFPLNKDLDLKTLANAILKITYDAYNLNYNNTVDDALFNEYVQQIKDLKVI